MKKKIYSILMLAMALFSLTGCEKELMDYEGNRLPEAATWIDDDSCAGSRRSA